MPDVLYADTVFLDRDGTINAKAPERDYIDSPDRLRLLPGAGRAVRRLNDLGIRVVLVTNQRGVALGRMCQADLDGVHRRLAELLAGHGARLDASYACPHDIGECHCRKPLPGLLLRAARTDPAIDLARAVIVGDAESDVRAGQAAGTRAVRLAPDGTASGADHLAPDLDGAVDRIRPTGAHHHDLDGRHVPAATGAGIGIRNRRNA